MTFSPRTSLAQQSRLGLWLSGSSGHDQSTVGDRCSACRNSSFHYCSTAESTWADVVFGDGLSKLEQELTRLGLNFDWNPDRPAQHPWAKPMQHEELAKIVRTFLVHVKSNGWTAQTLDERLSTQLVRLNGFRTRLFLSIFGPVYAEWERRLAANGSVDFEDMLGQAADHLEAGRVESPYDLVMVDEFQDASRARARLVRGLLNRPSRFLLAVGDDWQAINRFAGAELSVMTQFEAWFGRGQQLALTTTFRCSQTICDVARGFVARNPSQFDKPMRSARAEPGPAVQVVRADDPSRAPSRWFRELSAAVAGSPAGHNAKVTVDVLGRYQHQRDLVPGHVPSQPAGHVPHHSRRQGAGGDYVVVVGMTTGKYGFPSSIEDDPVLDLAMPSPESFPHAEERRLLYVALTRARGAVMLITPPLRISPFVLELLGHPGVVADHQDRHPEPPGASTPGQVPER
jgi:DNA helicase-4